MLPGSSMCRRQRLLTRARHSSSTGARVCYNCRSPRGGFLTQEGASRGPTRSCRAPSSSAGPFSPTSPTTSRRWSTSACSGSREVRLPFGAGSLQRRASKACSSVLEGISHLLQVLCCYAVARAKNSLLRTVYSLALTLHTAKHRLQGRETDRKMCFGL